LPLARGIGAVSGFWEAAAERMSNPKPSETAVRVMAVRVRVGGRDELIVPVVRRE
jgi:hypothetical protein